MNLDLLGKTALVCGASQGIGAATAKQLAELGCRVILSARSKDKLEKLKASMKNPEDHWVFPVDLSKTDELAKEITSLVDTVGDIEILICNAGGPKAGPLAEADIENFEQGFRTHVVANQILVQALLPGMKNKKYGRVINIISTSVKNPIPNLGVSNTIRGAVANWAKSMANELGPMGITVNNVLPGFTETVRLDALKEAAGKRLGKTVSEVEDMWIKQVPARRFAKPEETAAAIAFLASPSASYISGINLPVDGGRLGCL